MACTARPAVLFRLNRQFSGNAGDGADAHLGLFDAAYTHAVADGIDCMPQNIEADADIGNSGWRKGGDVGEHGILADALKMSANIGG